MLQIKNVCENISSNIANELNLDDDKKSVINYGIFSFIQMGICIGLVILFGLIFKAVIEALIISFTISILRKSSGGVHASSPEKCAVIGTFVSVFMGVLLKHININFSLVILIGSVIFTWSYYIIYMLAPVDSIVKPIKSIKKKKRLRQSSIRIISFYLMIVVINLLYFYNMKNPIVLVYSLCIYMGLLWQVFSLTKYAYLLMGKLDKNFK